MVVVCPNDCSSGPEVAFKVQKRKLEAYSSVFSEMLANAKPGEIWQTLPVVKLVELASVMETILAIVCNMAERPSRSRLNDWSGACAVWEAAHKYGMHAVRFLAEATLL